MTRRTRGIHHVTAIAGDPQRNIDFYAGVLGLRLVKLTVNFDDPATYHLYYGDRTGRPGTALTFFPWPGAPRGRHGTGQATVTAFAVPPDSLPYWTERLSTHGVAFRGPDQRFGERVMMLEDPDGLRLELIGSDAAAAEPWDGGFVPAEHAIRGFHGVTLSLEGYEGTARLLADTLGLRRTREEGNRYRHQAEGDGPGRIVDILCLPGAAPGRIAAGTVHHVAFRAAGEDEQIGWRGDLAELGYNVTPVIDRQYFRSIYFREPGGVLFEIATDGPGFTIDEEVRELGSRLRLPDRLEPHRPELERILPPLRLSTEPAGRVDG